MTSESENNAQEMPASDEPRKPVNERAVPIGPGDVMADKYEIIQLIGQGGMGFVYEAREVDFDMTRTVALKVLRPKAFELDPEVEKRFQQEIKIAARMDHPNIVPIYTVGKHQGNTFFVMKYIRGESLGNYINDNYPLPEGKIRDLGAQVASALHHIHKAGAIHRDLKGTNILIDEDGHATLMDFGIAKIADANTSLTSSGAIVGTGPFISPEQWTGRADQRSDIFGFGVLLYQLSTGTLPFRAADVPSLINIICNEPHEPISVARPDLSEDLGDIVDRCLAKDPSKRYQSMLQVKEALSREVPAPKAPPVKAFAKTEHLIKPKNIPTPPDRFPIPERPTSANYRARRQPVDPTEDRLSIWTARIVYSTIVLVVGWILLPKISPPTAGLLNEKLGDALETAGMDDAPPYANAFDAYRRALWLFEDSDAKDRVVAKQNAVIEHMLEQGELERAEGRYRLALDHFLAAQKLRPDDPKIRGKVDETYSLLNGERAAE
ncbi:MAG: serine/threonine protein kinase [Deltaproteobacteria bacterium]|nr:serine/threonine protein kinase [Deltaproteobacteria bacterium]